MQGSYFLKMGCSIKAGQESRLKIIININSSQLKYNRKKPISMGLQHTYMKRARSQSMAVHTVSPQASAEILH